MKQVLKAFLYSLILACLSLYSVSWFWRNPLQLTIILIIISVLMLLVRRRKEDLVLYAIAGIGGAMAESTAIAAGVWDYAIPNFSGVPYWLPFLWGIGAVFIKIVSLEIDDLFKNRPSSKSRKK